MNEPTPTASPTQPESLTRLLDLTRDESEAARRHAINALSLIGPDLAQRVVDLTAELDALRRAIRREREAEHAMVAATMACDALGVDEPVTKVVLTTRALSTAQEAYDDARAQTDAIVGAL